MSPEGTDGDLTAAVPSLPSGIRSQEEMCRYFIPILKEKGSVVHKMGKRMARPAKKGEEVLTIINGEIVAKTTVSDGNSYVIRQESADHELYALDDVKFRQNYEIPGHEITDTEPRFEELRQRGFKYYERKGQALIYQVTAKDMEFVPSGKFQVSFSAFPQPLRVGDFLVTGLPDHKEIYMSRNASIYKDGLFIHAPGVLTQQQMLHYFAPRMKDFGVTVRRAGVRLARCAKRGEEVLTIVNGELMARTLVSDDTSMVVQEESPDREVYCLPSETFARSYNLPGKDITDQGTEFDILRERGYKYYEKTGGMVQMYKVTEEDMDFVPSGKFQVPFSSIPQPLVAGDYLVRGMVMCDDDDNSSAIYVARNAEQIFLSRQNVEIHYIFGSPLAHPPLSIALELEGLRTSGAIVRLTCATRENLLLLKKAWSGPAPAILHVSCHTQMVDAHGETRVLLEDIAGRDNAVPPSDFANLIIGRPPPARGSSAGGHHAPQVAVLNSCGSEALAGALLERGVERVVAVRTRQTLLDRAARDFTLSFYGELRAHRSVEAAFACAIASMRTSTDPRLPDEAQKFVLLPEGLPEFYLGSKRLCRMNSITSAALEPHIAVRVPFGVGEANCVGPLVYPRSPLMIPGPPPPSRMRFLFDTVQCFSNSNFQILKVCGPPGIGKKAFVGTLASFAAMPGGRVFSAGAVILQHSLESGVPSQEQMRDWFVPILMQKGTLVQKVGKLMARPAIIGETVLTVINGEVVARNVVIDHTSMVIRHDSADYELYVHSEATFLKNYEQPGMEITEQGSEYDALRDRGFKYYERKGMALVYKVTEDDMAFVPEGKFQVSFSDIPQPLKAGDYLATGYPNNGSGEVYLSRNAPQVYLSKVVRSNKEIRKEFQPLMTKRGTIARRVGTWLARPAKFGEQVMTVISGEVVAKTVVSDRSSMVVMAETAERELYVLDEQSFHRSYKQPGMSIAKEEPEFDQLRDQGFKYYERKGLVRIYQITEEDMKLVPAGKMWCSKSSVPHSLRIGDYLVADYPNPTEIYVSRNAEQVFAPAVTDDLVDTVRAQADMRDRFVPILLECGRRMRRIGHCAARVAQKGEKIRTIVNGEMVAKYIVRDDTSMVVREETADRELSVLSQPAFMRQHELPGTEIAEEGPEFDALRERGFMWYGRRGVVLLHRVTGEDMKFVPGGKFYVSNSTVPSPLKVGDHLALDFPDRGRHEVYLSRNALQVLAPIEGTHEEEGGPPPTTTRSARDNLDDSSSAAGSPILWLQRRSGTPESAMLSYSTTASGLGGVDEADRPSTSTARLGYYFTKKEAGGARELSDLEDALLAAASKQADLAGRWYHLKDQANNRARVARRDRPTEAEAAVDSWLRSVPSGSRALIILLEGARYLKHDAPRELLRRLLREHENLHLLVTMTDTQDNAPQLDPQIKEHPWVEIKALEPREAADLFLWAMQRHKFASQLLRHMSREEALARLECHPTVIACRGRPREILQRVEGIGPQCSSFTNL